ncbi:MAG: transcriptional repressor LexA [Acidobacteria bacterium]|nr:transcriptional repressor LexA [Acidobacteriota bacterium]
MALTRRQKEVLDFIASFVDTKGYSPSYEEIGEALGLASLASVHKHIEALEGKSYLRRSFNQSRSLEVSSKYLQERRQYAGAAAARGLSVPLLGTIAAGRLVESVVHETTLEFGDFSAQPSTYALKVRGESMIDDHICDGDYVLVEGTPNVRDGEIVVALVGGQESTLKRLYREGEVARLQPANSAMEPIRVPLTDLQVQGRVLAVLRKFR